MVERRGAVGYRPSRQGGIAAKRRKKRKRMASLGGARLPKDSRREAGRPEPSPILGLTRPMERAEPWSSARSRLGARIGLTMVESLAPRAALIELFGLLGALPHQR